MAEAVNELVDRLRGLLAKATPGPWCWEQCGEKEDVPVVGTAFRDDNTPLSGLVSEQDAGAEGYIRFGIAHDIQSNDGCSASSNAALIVAAVNALPVLLDALASSSAGENARLREALGVGEQFLNACNSAWSCGEPLHRVKTMLNKADEFRASLDVIHASDDAAARLALESRS